MLNALANTTSPPSQPGGQDSQLVIADLSNHLDATFLFQTSDSPPASIQVRTFGWRTGPLDVLRQLANASTTDNVDPRSYKFRLDVSFETGDERYKDLLNTGLWVGSEVKKGNESESFFAIQGVEGGAVSMRCSRDC